MEQNNIFLVCTQMLGHGFYWAFFEVNLDNVKIFKWYSSNKYNPIVYCAICNIRNISQRRWLRKMSPQKKGQLKKQIKHNFIF